MSGILRKSCIIHPQNLPFVAIRPEYLGIVDGNRCAAAILAIFEHWHNVKLWNIEQVQTANQIAARGGVLPDQDESLWIYKSHAELRVELLGIFGEKIITAALKKIVSKKFLATRNNPKYGWDRTLQYQFEVETVQKAVQNWYQASQADNAQKCAMQAAEVRDQKRGNAEAIPVITSTKELNTFGAVAPDAPKPVQETVTLQELITTLKESVTGKPEPITISSALPDPGGKVKVPPPRKPQPSDALYDALSNAFFDGVKSDRVGWILWGNPRVHCGGLVASEATRQGKTKATLDFKALAALVPDFKADYQNGDSSKELKECGKFVERWEGWRNRRAGTVVSVTPYVRIKTTTAWGAEVERDVHRETLKTMPEGSYTIL